MSNDLVTTTSLIPVSDSIDGFTAETDGATKKGGVIQGSRIKFGNSGEWEDADGEVIPAENTYVVTDVKRVLTRWGQDKRPAETIVLGAGEVIPNLDGEGGWNAQLPKSEWVEGPGGLRGPWQFQYVVTFTDPTTMQASSWPTSAVGGRIAVEQLVSAIQSMRRFRPGALPVVGLESTHMKTRFGGRSRPHIQIHDWLGGVEREPQHAALPAPHTPAAPTAMPVVEAQVIDVKPEPVAAAVAVKPKARKGIASKSFALGGRVKPVSLSEELNDSIPEFLG
jgi:hypothetical protein